MIHQTWQSLSSHMGSFVVLCQKGLRSGMTTPSTVCSLVNNSNRQVSIHKWPLAILDKNGQLWLNGNVCMPEVMVNLTMYILVLQGLVLAELLHSFSLLQNFSFKFLLFIFLLRDGSETSDAVNDSYLFFFKCWCFICYVQMCKDWNLTFYEPLW